MLVEKYFWIYEDIIKYDSAYAEKIVELIGSDIYNKENIAKCSDKAQNSFCLLEKCRKI